VSETMKGHWARGSVLRWPCPIPNCSFKGRNQAELEEHLQKVHRKDELARWIMDRISPKLEKAAP